VLYILKILLVHNKYGKPSGEEESIKNLSDLLKKNGHSVTEFFRSSSEISDMPFGKIRAFFSGIYSHAAQKRMGEYLHEVKPDIVHIHNLFPLISPSILSECKRRKIPVVMSVHNYRLMCPNGLYMSNGSICEKCNGGKEYWCIFRNCEREFFKSLGYAIRNYWARKRGMFRYNVTRYICLTNFQANKLTAEGFPPDRIEIIPHMTLIKGDIKEISGDYVDYVGRVSPEKGIATLIKAAKNCTDVQFRVSGANDRFPDFEKEASSNVKFLGILSKERIASLFNTSRMLVFPSIWYEGFPMVLVEAMMMGLPVISSRIGGLAEIVDDNVTGLLFEPGNDNEMAEKIRYLWERPDLCLAMGRAGREKALREYSSEKYYESLIAVYKKAISGN